MKDIREYEDIIDLPHPRSGKYGEFTRAERAAQFAPFAALTGHEDELDKEAALNEENMLHDLEVELFSDMEYGTE